MTTARTSLLPLALLISALTAGCNDYKLQPSGDDNTGTTPTEPPADAPDIEVEPASLDFGGVLKNCPSAPLEIVVRNVGASYLDVTDLAFGSNRFEIDWDGAAFQLAPGEERAFLASFTPEAYSTYETELTVRSNDPDEAELGVPTEGYGDASAMFEEGFRQQNYDAVDVLWVVDNSCSMDEEQGQMRTNFASFISEFVALSLDYQMAIVTTDMDNRSQAGQFVGSIMTPATPNIETEFQRQANQGSGGSGDERGMDAVYAALTEPLRSGTNAGFIRDEAALAVVVLSDEDDFSRIADATFQSWFQGLKADAAKVSFNAIVGDPTTGGLFSGGCTDWAGSTMLSASAGDRYVNMANATGGVWRSICYADYAETMQHISLTSAGMVTTFNLSETPTNFGLIQVWVGGVQWYYGLYDGWTYDSSNNSVTFHGDAIPEVGEYVLLQYPINGECSG